MRRRTRDSLGLLATVLIAGCVPTHAAFLHVPVTVAPRRPAGLVIVRLPIEELAKRMEEFDVERIAVFHRGREPIPHQIVDIDGDGRLDTVVTKIPAGAGNRAVAVVCPARKQNRDPLPEGGSAEGVTIDMEHSQR